MIVCHLICVVQYVLTAGHCLIEDCNKKGKCSKRKKDNLIVIIGDHDLYSQGETCLDKKTLRVANVILHEDFLGVKDADGYVVKQGEITVSVDLLMERDHLRERHWTA